MCGALTLLRLCFLEFSVSLGERVFIKQTFSEGWDWITVTDGHLVKSWHPYYSTGITSKLVLTASSSSVLPVRARVYLIYELRGHSTELCIRKCFHEAAGWLHVGQAASEKRYALQPLHLFTCVAFRRVQSPLQQYFCKHGHLIVRAMLWRVVWPVERLGADL